MTTILGASSSGMVAAQRMLDRLANNAANANSVGFKRIRPIAEGLPEAGQQPEGGRLGVSLSDSDVVMTQGSPMVTNDPLHFAIGDSAYVRLQLEDGTTGFTRAGALQVDGAGQVTLAGKRLDPAITLPPGVTSPQVTADGRIVGRDANNNEVAAGQLQLTRFTNPTGLQNIGGGLYIETSNTGATVTGTAGSDGFADLQTGRLEGSNVDLAEEMVQMLVAQRTYSSCARTFSIGDEMLRIATDLTQ